MGDPAKVIWLCLNAVFEFRKERRSEMILPGDPLTPYGVFTP